MATARIVDLVGYGGANFFEGTGPAPALSNTAAALRGPAGSGCQDTDQNGADFAAGTPTPRNTGAPPAASWAPPSPTPTIVCPTAFAVPEGEAATRPVSASDPDGRVGALTVTTAPTGVVLVDVVPAGAAGGTAAATLQIPASPAAGDHTIRLTATNDDATPQQGTCQVMVSVTSTTPVDRIRDIQGRAYVSPAVGQPVTRVPGIVTAIRSFGSTRGFYLQDPEPDADADTSEGIFVFTGSTSNPDAQVSVGDGVLVSGTASEFRAGGASSANLSTSQISGSLTVVRLSAGNALPAPVVVGVDRIAPGEAITDDVNGDAELLGLFDPASDGLDFYESLEGMRIAVRDAAVVGPRAEFSVGGASENREVVVLAEGGAGAALRTPRGGILIRPGDFNPERIVLNDALGGGRSPQIPAADVGDVVTGPSVGVLDHAFGNFRIQLTELGTIADGGLEPEITDPHGPGELSVERSTSRTSTRATRPTSSPAWPALS